MPAPDSTEPEPTGPDSSEADPREPESSEPDPSELDQAELDQAGIEELLATAHLEILGRMPWSSNLTLLCELRADEDGPALGRGVYKPLQGERPLWDFPDGLYRREVGAYHLARSIGWDSIPPTVERDGPYGVGSLQWFVDADFDQHYFTLLEDPQHHDQLRRLCAFDLVANSTDRKSGHVLVDGQGHLWGIDNGLCLHAEFKLRTVIWDFAGEPLDRELADDLIAFAERPLPEELVDLLDPFERDALRMRATALVSEGHLPTDPTGRRYPWPLV